MFEEIRLAMLEVEEAEGPSEKSSQRKKAREKFELINIILPEISKKSSEILSRDEPDLAPIITRIMDVFRRGDVGMTKRASHVLHNHIQLHC